MLRLSMLAGTAAATALFALAAPVTASPLSGPQIATVPHFSGVRDLGRAAASTTVTVTLSLPYRHRAELEGLVQAQGDEDSPLYQHFLSSAQFNSYFAPSVGDYNRVTQSLKNAGFAILSNFPNRTIVNASAPARTVERFFNTEIHTVRQDGQQGTRYANSRPATLPREMVGAVETLVGLDNLSKAHYTYQFGPRHPVNPDNIGLPLHGPDGGYGPLATAQGYDFPVQHGKDGTGFAVANVAGDVLDTDISAFMSEFGVTRTGTTLRTQIQPGSQGANVEATLDIETMGALDPGATMHLYILSNPVDTPGETAYNQIVTDNSVTGVNSSFGVCENQDASYGTAARSIIIQGESLGISWSASTGDGGAHECNGPQLLPAAIPEVLGVGGTHLVVDSNGNYTSESAWSGGGGGVSTTYANPSYQNKIKGRASLIKRNLPDVSFAADVQDSFYYQGQWQGPIGGTSWASPISIALRAEINQTKGLTHGAGFVNPKIYMVFKKHHYGKPAHRVFRDITTGNNGFAAGPGYDNATGLGSIDGFDYAPLERK